MEERNTRKIGKRKMSDKEREKKEERKNGDNVQREKEREREKRMGEPALRTYYLEMAPLKRFCDLFIYIYIIVKVYFQ